MMEVAAGGEGQKLLERQIFEMLLLMLGLATKEIYLNGGSESRRIVKEYWIEIAETYGIPVKTNGFMVKLG